jgi:L,D-transpeptidase-like protein
VTSPKRLTALSGAVLVTVLTCAGALGIGPGAARGETSAAGGSTNAHAPRSAGGSPARQPGSQLGGGGWLTVTKSPAAVPTTEAPSGPTPSVPSGGTPDPLALPAHSGQGKRIVYDISAQRVWLVNRHGDVARTYLVSGSRRPHLLAPGRYAVRSMSPQAVSFNGKETMRYMVRFASGKHSAIGFHDIPARNDGSLVESRSQLGTPQSAGCIRQWITDAKALWEFASVGTPVVVTA